MKYIVYSTTTNEDIESFTNYESAYDYIFTNQLENVNIEELVTDQK